MRHESGMAEWLAALPSEDGFLNISGAKRFAHDEAKYDEQYQNEATDMQVGQGIMNVLREAGAPFDGPALEVGCGTGLATVGMLALSPYPLVIATDPSPAFLKITREKLKAQNLMSERVRLAVMLGEEIDRVPPASLSLILLRSTLHHILKPKQFLRDAARTLRPGGILTCEEPCLEGYLMMGAIAQFFPVVAKQAGEELSTAEAEKVDLFVRSMQFYSRRDVDKSQAEDKHLFRVDELMETGADCGLHVKFHPNVGYRYFAAPQHQRAGGAGFRAGLRRAVRKRYRSITGKYPKGWFRKFSGVYVKECMGWDEPLSDKFERLMGVHCDYVDESCRGGRVPYLNGTFVFRRVG